MTLELTLDEQTVVVEALREYRLRMDLTRRTVAEALIFRLLHTSRT